MKKYLNQTTVNVIAIASAVAWGACLVGNVLDRGPNKAMQEQMLANRRLDYNIARLKNCGELKRFGIQYHPESPMHFLCADVIVAPLNKP